MNRDKARKFIEEQMPNFKIVDSETEDEAGGGLEKVASADATDVDVNTPSLDAWKKAASSRETSQGAQVQDLRDQFRRRKLQGRSGASSSTGSNTTPGTAESAGHVDRQDLRSGKTGVVSVRPKNAPDDSALEPQDLVIDEDEGIIGASS